jgi:CheY-like chemotaxis protein
MMPGLDGQGAFAVFQQMPATAKTPVIFMTARVQPREILEYRRLGSLGVIPKPFDPNTLAQTIQGMWDRHRKDLMNETRREDLAALRLVYAGELPGRLHAIESAAQSLRDRGFDGAVTDSLYEMAHRLAGSAAIYGFAGVSETAVRVGAFSHEPAASRVASDLKPLLKAVTALSDALRAVTTTGVEPMMARP